MYDRMTLFFEKKFYGNLLARTVSFHPLDQIDFIPAARVNKYVNTTSVTLFLINNKRTVCNLKTKYIKTLRINKSFNNLHNAGKRLRL